ncbi:hypothetical protein D6817_01470 [Candidatus Pacearchaeota archaeon]|nr:MAG: hypothetical protein D6817_01470 [Candidatus Pacearchaeota archaeon]
MLQKYTQTTYESCLACCLLQAVARVKPLKISKKLELACLLHSLKFSKHDFVIGHVDFIVKKFNVRVTRIVGSKRLFDHLKRKRSRNLSTKRKRIDLSLINKFLDKQPIVEMDVYHLYRTYHYPHFITILGKTGNKYKIFDTWDGKEKFVRSKTLANSISSLKNRLKLSPQMIIVE